MPNDSASTLRLLQKILGDADNISAQGEHAAAQAAMAIQSLFVAYQRNQNLQNSAEIRAAISALFQDLQDPSAYDPARFAGKMRAGERAAAVSADAAGKIPSSPEKS